MDYFEIEKTPTEDMSFCILAGYPEGTTMFGYKMAKGKPAAAQYPGTPAWQMTRKYPGIKVASLIANEAGLLVLARQVADAIVATKAPLELLPFRLLDHKGRAASEAHVIVNPLGPVDCLDLERSEIRYSGGAVVAVRRKVLDPQKLRDVPAIFRVKEDPHAILLSHGLVTQLKRLTPTPTNIYLEQVEQGPGSP